MVETVYDLCQPSVFTTTFPPNPVQVFSSSEPIYRCVTANMKVIRTQSDPNWSYFLMGILGEDV